MWTTIPDSDIDPDSPFTTGLATAYRENVSAAFEGASGAPALQTAALEQTGGSEAVTQACIRAAAVGQTELKSTTGEVSTTSTTGVLLTLPGGSYGYYPQLRISDAAGTAYWGWDSANSLGLAAAQFGGTSYSTNLLLATSNVSYTAYAQQRYAQASPPYDLGDGEIPLFVFVMIDNSTGKVESVYVAPEAPWHYNGKTSIAATRKDAVTGKSYQNVKAITAELMDTGKSIRQAVNDKMFTHDEIADRLIDDALIEIEITQAIKNADMTDIPHPFIGNNLAGKSVIMLDPVSTEKLLALHDAGEDLNTLIHDGTLSLDNIPLVRATPNGVTAVSFTL